jgi:hypothetical protein
MIIKAMIEGVIKATRIKVMIEGMVKTKMNILSRDNTFWDKGTLF